MRGNETSAIERKNKEGSVRNAAITKQQAEQQRDCSLTPERKNCLRFPTDEEDCTPGSRFPCFLKWWRLIDQGINGWISSGHFGQNICYPWEQRNGCSRARLRCSGWILIHRIMLLFLSVLTRRKHITIHSYYGLTSSHSLPHLEEYDRIQQLLLPAHLPSLLLLASLPSLKIREALCFTPHNVALHFVGQQTMLAFMLTLFYSALSQPHMYKSCFYLSPLIQMSYTPLLFWAVLALWPTHSESWQVSAAFMLRICLLSSAKLSWRFWSKWHLSYVFRYHLGLARKPGWIGQPTLHKGRAEQCYSCMGYLWMHLVPMKAKGRFSPEYWLAFGVWISQRVWVTNW